MSAWTPIWDECRRRWLRSQAKTDAEPFLADLQKAAPIEHPTDPTPTHVRWTIEDGWLFGIEQPDEIEHLDRLAGRYILDCGEYREIRHLGMELPKDFATAMTLRFKPTEPDPMAENEDGTTGPEHVTDQGIELK